MNVLILGSGGREHAIAWKMSQSKSVNNIIVAPGNAGTIEIAHNIPVSLNDFEEISEIITRNNIDLLVVGPEEPLVKGIIAFLNAQQSHQSLLIVGPDAEGAKLEGSKDFAKEFMNKYNIPTAGYFSANADNYSDALEYMKALKPPYVLKADGLAAGKGVLIIDDYDEAADELNKMLNGKFGEASSTVVIEEFLDGIECSVFVLTDGNSYIVLPEAKDYKRIGENNTGLNTGGMGAVSPVPFYNEEFAKKVEDRIIKPTIEGIKTENMDYRGFVFFGLISVNKEPFVIEYNVRMGDPETEVVMPRIKSDLCELLVAAAKKELANHTIEIYDEACATIMLVSGGYPQEYEKEKVITGLENLKDSMIFHAGTSIKDNVPVTSGGRVIAVSSMGTDIFDALDKSYKSAKEISFEKMYYRRDLGFDLK